MQMFRFIILSPLMWHKNLYIKLQKRGNPYKHNRASLTGAEKSVSVWLNHGTLCSVFDGNHSCLHFRTWLCIYIIYNHLKNLN